MHSYIGALIVFVIASILLVPLLYQAKKWNFGNYKKWSSFRLGDDDKPEDLRFNGWMGNLIVGKEEIPYPVIRDLPDFDIVFRKWLVNSLNTRTPVIAQSGRSGYIITDMPVRKWYAVVTVVLSISAITFIASRVMGDAFLPALSQNQKGILSSTLMLIVSTANLLYIKLSSGWAASTDKLRLGKWFFSISIPLSEIHTIDIGLARSKLAVQKRQAGFMLEIKKKDRSFALSDARLGTLLSLYDAIIARRPDLKIS